MCACTSLFYFENKLSFIIIFERKKENNYLFLHNFFFLLFSLLMILHVNCEILIILKYFE